MFTSIILGSGILVLLAFAGAVGAEIAGLGTLIGRGVKRRGGRQSGWLWVWLCLHVGGLVGLTAWGTMALMGAITH